MSTKYVLADAPKNPHQAAVSGNSDLVIHDEDRPLLEENALKGDASLAHRIFKFEYARGNIKEALHWAQISAENGSSQGAYSYGFLLMKQPDKESKLRAEFWLEKSSKEGNNLATDALAELKSQNKN